MTPPRVSVILPSYNCPKYIVAALKSLQRQTMGDFEAIIIDQSTDATPVLINDFVRRDPRFRVIYRSTPGIVPALNAGLAEARGEYIARMDADDIALPRRFARQLEYLDHHPECVALGCAVLHVDPDNAPIRCLGQPLTHEEIDARHLRGRSGALAHPTLMARRGALLAVGGYRPEYADVEDLDLFLRLAEHGRLANLPQVLYRFRLHFGSVTHQRGRRQLELTVRTVREACTRRGLPQPQLHDLPLPHDVSPFERMLFWAVSALRGGYPATCRKYAWQAWRMRPEVRRSRFLLALSYLPTQAAVRLLEWRDDQLAEPTRRAAA